LIFFFVDSFPYKGKKTEAFQEKSLRSENLASELRGGLEVRDSAG